MLKNKITIGLVLGCLLVFAVVSVVGANEEKPWEKYDLEGRTITINMRNTGITPFAPRGEMDWLDPGPKLKEHIESVEGKFDINIEFINLSNRSEALINGVLAGDPPADVFCGMTWAGKIPMSLAAEGVIHPISRFIEEEWVERMPEIYQPMAFTANYKGDYYAFLPYLFKTTEQMAIVFNKDLFEREDLPSPYDLVEKDEWNWDTFRELAIEGARDTTGDGEIDQFGAVGYWGIADNIINWALTNDVNLTKMEDGKEVFTFNTPQVAEAFDYWKEIGEMGVAEPTLGNAAGIVHDGKALMSIQALHTLNYDSFREADLNYGVVPLPKGPEADEYVGPKGVGFSPNAVIPITETQPRALIEVMSALFKLTVPYIEDLDEFEEEFYEELSMMVRDRRSLEMLRIITKNPLPFNSHKQHVVKMEEFKNNYKKQGAIWQEDKDAYSVLQEITPVVQSYLDELYE